MLSMYRKRQDSGLTEIIPFKYLSAIWGQRPAFFSRRPGPQCPLRGGCSLMAVRQQTLFFLGTLHTQKFTFGGPESLTAVTCLFIDTAGNTPFLSVMCVLPCPHPHPSGWDRVQTLARRSSVRYGEGIPWLAWHGRELGVLGTWRSEETSVSVLPKGDSATI